MVNDEVCYCTKYEGCLPCRHDLKPTLVDSLAYLKGYEDGLTKAAWIVDGYADERLVKVGKREAHPSQDIYAALHVAAMRIQECDPPEYADIVSDVTVRNST